MASSKERILFIAEAEAWGGAERSFLTLSNWLHRNSLPYRLLVYWDRVGLEKFADHCLVKTELQPKPNAWSKISSLRKYFASQPANALKPLMSGYQPALHATLAGLHGFHCMMHDTETLFDDEDRKPSVQQKTRLALNRQILRRGLNSGGKTIVASEFLKRDTERLYKAKAVIARIGSPVEGISFRPRAVETELRMLSVSRIEVNKRIDWILRALASLEHQPLPLSRQIDWQFDIAGDGTQRAALRALTQQLGISGRVMFHGFVSDEELAKLYEQANLFLMPARQGYGIPAIEALHRGIPVLLHRESGVSDILLDTPWAAVFTGGQAELSFALDKIMHSVAAGTHLNTPPPYLPTEDSWAEEMTRICDWL